MKYLKLFSLFFLLQTGILFADEEVEKLNAATLNTILLFTAHDALSSGLYHFTKTKNRVDMHIYHLPLSYQFDSSSKLNYFILGDLGVNFVSIENNEQYNNYLKAYIGGIGGGIRYKMAKDLYFLVGLELIYSRIVLNATKYENSKIVDIFNNQHSDNLSVEFSTLAEYKPKIHAMKPYISFLYKHFETKSEISLEAFTKYNSSSSVATLRAGVESAPFYSGEENYCTVEGYVGTNYFWGNAKDIIKFQSYETVGGIFYYNTPKKPWWASRFYVELSGVKGNGLEGYNAGVGFSLAY